MGFDSRTLDFPVVAYVWCLFRPTLSNSGFAAACSAADIIASSLMCSVRIERSGFLEYRRLWRFKDLVFLLTDQAVVGFSLGR
ncbi:hypothetical protein DY000_02008286 [Brassica cretica]|uniref:Uncharacterized protein n=1 Tax=Brassica cretica TaxID=69181 RepID=A0ABQ7C9U4_BRACR|nr:hypothetical protein DY000_02008286 [Brassica cretica]